MLVVRLLVRPAELERGGCAVSGARHQDHGALAVGLDAVEGELPLLGDVARQSREAVDPRTEGAGRLGAPQPALGDVHRGYFLPFSVEPAPSLERAATKASWGTSTRPTIFIRFLPSFCFSSSLRLRVMSPP